ncbi:hypothetical protein EDC37_11433 [Pectinatus cerevisiiphilus]|uniref:Uncharacterized protein n=1 Tax=Pectinatus cerevisiiphilus TaxID=86956 RepID=A0A4V2URH1_9FIRM|nr:hypothetical protein EDC37_11433 [Pectinatus cerevisiiphilus]
MRNCQAKLDVGFYLAGMGCAVEKPKLDCPLGESRMQVQPMIAGAVVMLIASAGILAIPDVGQFRHGSRFLLVDDSQKIRIRLFAVTQPIAVNFQGSVKDVLFAGDNVHDVPQGLRREAFRADMDMNAAGTVGKSPFLSELPHQFLHIFNILVMKDWADHLSFVIISGADFLPIKGFFLRPDTGIPHGLPSPALAIRGFMSVISPADVSAVGAEISGNGFHCLRARNPREFHLNTECLCFHVPHPRFRLLCFPFRYVYISL